MTRVKDSPFTKLVRDVMAAISSFLDAETFQFVPSTVFSFSVGNPTLKEPHMPLEISCTDEQKVHVGVHPVTLKGKPVKLDGPITVAVQSGDGTFEVDADGYGFFAISGDDPGDTAYLVNGDADLGPGTQTIADVVILHVADAQAANLGIAADAPVLK
jgi:hypothetical protein